MTRKEAEEIRKYCKDNKLDVPTVNRMPQTQIHSLIWYQSFDTRYTTYKGAKHFVRSLEYEKGEL